MPLVLALVCGLQAMPASAQTCSVRDFTFREVEKITFSDVVRHTGISLARPDKTEQKQNDFEGSGAIYGVPGTLHYDEARALSGFMLRASGFAYLEDVALSLVRTALSKTGAEMYKNCAAAKSIQISIPDAAYTEPGFNLTVSWTPTGRSPETVDYEIAVLGGRVQGKGGVIGTMRKGGSKDFDIERSGSGLLKIDVTVHGQAYPAIALPSLNKQMAAFKIEKRGGKSAKPVSAPGNECGDRVHLVSEEGTPAKATSKSCRQCVAKSANGFLLVSSAKADGQFSGTGKAALELNSPTQMCALFSVEGRGKTGGRQEVQNGMFHVLEVVPSE